tara:strand:+ start:636 stop:1052 length:417 start_codon:yes stop_codon:yes gene_type:complete
LKKKKARSNRLSTRQQAFIYALIGAANFDARQAAALAGYSDPIRESTRQLNHVYVKEAIETALNRKIGTPAQIMFEVSTLARDTNNAVKDRLKAYDIMAKIMGLYQHRLEVTHIDEIVVSIGEEQTALEGAIEVDFEE